MPVPVLAYFDKIVLRPVLKQEVGLVYTWALDIFNSKTWRYRGLTPSPDSFEHDMWAGVLAQFMVCRRSDGEQVALATIYSANMAARRAHIACLASPQHAMSGLPLLGAMAMIDYAFETWPFEKIYIESTSQSMRFYSTALKSELLVEEARLVDYERFGDEVGDLIYLSVERKRFIDRVAEHNALRRGIANEGMRINVGGTSMVSAPPRMESA